jgi:thioredoxin 1
MEKIIDVTIETFEQEVLKHDGQVAVKFYRSKGCANCEKMGPIFETFADANPTVKCVQINADENKELPLPVSFRTLPGIFFYEKGEFIGHSEGVVDLQQLSLPFTPINDLKIMAYDMNSFLAQAESIKKQLDSVNGIIQKRSQLK